MNTDKVLKLFASDTTSLGCWLKVPSPTTAELAAQAGFDYLCVDMQHGMVGRSDLLTMLQAIQPHNCRTLVRVPSNEFSIIGWALDMGATGVIVPLINSAADAEAALQATQYPPVGNRSMGPTRAIRVFGDACIELAGTVIPCIPMIESLKALQNLDEILAVPGVNVIYVGPSDLSVHLGLERGNNDGEPTFDNALATIIDACQRHNVIPGIHSNHHLAKRRIDAGFRLLTVAEDDTAMQSGFVTILEGLDRSA